MAIVFVGGARTAGKSQSLRSLMASFPRAGHLELATTVRLTAPRAKFNGGVKMRNLSKGFQLKAVGEILDRLGAESKERLVFVDGHFTSSVNRTKKPAFFPVLRRAAHVFDLIVLVKSTPEQIVLRRSAKGNKPRELNVVRAEVGAEEKEARALAKKHGKELVVCRPEQFAELMKQKLAQMGILRPGRRP